MRRHAALVRRILVATLFLAAPSAGLVSAPSAARANPGEARPARAPKLEQLVNQKLRPRMSRLRRAYGRQIPHENPFTRVTDANALTSTLRTMAPRFIAVLERTYPDATYLALGRDAVQLADVMDAYYTHMGQPHRVARINASSSSFTGSQQDIIDFLKHNTPIDFSDPHKVKGFVLFDNTSYGTSSQSHLVMDAIYAEYARLGYDMREVHRKIGIVSTYSGHPIGNTPEEAEQAVGGYFAEQVESRANNPTAPVTRPFHVPEAASAMYGAEWHGPWGSFTRGEDGRVTTEPTYENPSSHEGILADFHDTLVEIESGAFHQSVVQAAAAIGARPPVMQTPPPHADDD